MLNKECIKCIPYILEIDDNIGNNDALNSLFAKFIKFVETKRSCPQSSTHFKDTFVEHISKGYIPSKSIVNELFNTRNALYPCLETLVKNKYPIDKNFYKKCIDSKKWNCVILLSNLIEPEEAYLDSIPYNLMVSNEIIANMLQFKLSVNSEHLIKAIRVDNDVLVELFLQNGAKFDQSVIIFICRNHNEKYIKRIFEIGIKPNKEMYDALFINLKPDRTFHQKIKIIRNLVDQLILNGYKLTVEDLYTALNKGCVINNIEKSFKIEVLN